MSGLVKRIRRLNAAMAAGEPVHSVRMRATFATIGGQPVTFCTNMKNDPIQRNHRRGQFYEQAELQLLATVLPRGGTYLDIGANVGNHSLFFAMFLGAERVVPIEPNPRAYELLIANVLANRLSDRVSLDHLGVGLADAGAEGFAMEDRQRNLGGARMLPGEGAIAVHRGDELLAGERPDVIKIDVESMEIAVLRGLEGLIAAARPLIFVEVDDENADAFSQWCQAHDYETVHRHRRYRTNENFLLADTGRAPELAAKISAAASEKRKEKKHA